MLTRQRRSRTFTRKVCTLSPPCTGLARVNVPSLEKLVDGLHDIVSSLFWLAEER